MKTMMACCVRTLHIELSFHSFPCGNCEFGELKCQLNIKTCGWILLPLWFSIYCSSDCTIKCIIRLTSDTRRFSVSLFLRGHLINAWWRTKHCKAQRLNNSVIHRNQWLHARQLLGINTCLSYHFLDKPRNSEYCLIIIWSKVALWPYCWWD